MIIGWVLYVGKDIFVPIVLGILVVYVIVGLARLLGRIPWLGRTLPVQARYTLSVLVIALGLVFVVYLVIANRDSVLALAPNYQESLLAAIQKVAVFFHIETEPTWATLRQRSAGADQRPVAHRIDGRFGVLHRRDLHRRRCSTRASCCVEQRSFATKIANLSSDPHTRRPDP